MTSGRAPVLLVGAGGIGAPVGWALGLGGLPALDVADDDRVEIGNLHRQILFADDDVGRPKLDAFAERLRARFPRLAVGLHRTRATPETAASLVAGRAVVVDATDNFATRFLLADACHLAGVAVVHAAAIRWRATVLTALPEGRPCYRCLFEAPPSGAAPDCATAGVLGPVCGVAGAIAADHALGVLRGRGGEVAGRIVTFDGLRDRLREVRVASRGDCALCGREPSIRSLDAERYVAVACAAEERHADPASIRLEDARTQSR